MLRRCLLSAGCVLAVSAPCFAAGGRGHHAPPAPARSFLRFTLAGADVRDGLAFIRYDAKAGYYLYGQPHGDSRPYESASLTLSPERDDEAVEDKTPVQAATLPRLRSGKGVNLGDSPVGVKRKLGALPTTTSYDRRTRELVYTYETVFSLTRGGMVRRRMDYAATYTFHDSRLWAVEYALSKPDTTP